VLLLAGTVQALVLDGERREAVGDHVAPTWLGAIPTLTEVPMGVRMQAITDVRIATIAPDAFLELVLAHRAVFRRVMAKVLPVVGRITALEQDRERLASLGTMAAGLAHELNNPAAAAKRASADLADALDVLGSTIGLFVESGVEREEAAQLVAMQREALNAAEERPALTGLAAADAEDELAEALAAAGVGDGWRVAEPLARAGVDREFLARASRLAGPATEAAVRWVAASLTARELAAELAESTERMSRLVGAVKTYAYMDRGGLVEVDLHEGLETTLTILGHKLKHTTIEIVRDYDPALPRFLGHGAELNQVWTNLLDNAIDAVGDSGTITVTTRIDGDCVEVDIADDGPGIPDDVRERIFDPFFTTKEVGLGTGLGLDTARRILVDRHGGSLSVESQPGRTVFRARVPMEGAANTHR
jgi:signal transduction histidine kinase